MSEALFGVLIAAGAALVGAFAGAWLSVRLQFSTPDWDWRLRQERVEAYLELLAAVDDILEPSGTGPEARDGLQARPDLEGDDPLLVEPYLRVHEATERVTLVGPEETRAAADALAHSAGLYVQKVQSAPQAEHEWSVALDELLRLRRAFHDAARADLARAARIDA